MTPEQKCRKAEYLLESYRLRKGAVASVCVQPPSSKEILTDAQRQGTQAWRDALERGDNLYDKYTDRTKRKSESDGKALDAGGKKLDANEGSRPAHSKAGNWYLKPKDYHAVTLSVDLRREVEPKEWPKVQSPDGQQIDDPSVRCCSFCASFFDAEHATEGYGKDRKTDTGETETSFFPDGSVSWIHQKVLHTRPTLTACPDCVLHLEKIK